MSELDETGVSNNKFFREISNYLDEHGFNGSVRAFIHGIYHCGVGALKGLVGNFEGASAEFGRSGEQFRKISYSPDRDND